jgi:TIR domain
MGVDPQPRVFLSYRRREDQHFIGRIHDRLVAEFGEENVFRDVESIGGAENFLAAITNRLAESDILLSVIGPQWSLGPTAGQRDWVHVELERALERQMLVIPVCLDSTPVPSRDSLPPAIQGLVDVNALWIDGTNHFASDMAKLTRLIRTEVAARRAALTARHALHRVVFVRDSPEPPQSARSSGGRSRKRWAVPAIAAAVARCSAWVSTASPQSLPHSTPQLRLEPRRPQAVWALRA